MRGEVNPWWGSRSESESDKGRGSETAGDKLRRREGNSPDHQLRPLSGDSVGKDVELRRQPGGWLGSSHP
ncbi:unnamed protein product [Enterobius vermicularis]|uniref:Uncharacterized protein n=1 Tax=Enterobius vermicularis TaxID=51028 RepID=A0A0N4VQR8_ENTVE|nr:unnamed protein product [Enterobius vermicularis]